ncbi:MAG: hypothetical protein WKF29_10660 [Thermoleophilaceae bacterium]
MFDYEWATTQLGLNCRLASRTLVPDAIPIERLERLGARGDKLVRYPGLKEEYYLYDFEADAGVLTELGLDPARVLCGWGARRIPRLDDRDRRGCGC